MKHFHDFIHYGPLILVFCQIFKVTVRHMDETILPELGPDLTLFFNMFIEMLLDKTVSAPGRDNVLTLLAKNVPRDQKQERFDAHLSCS